jgi:hypothetical protein
MPTTGIRRNKNDPGIRYSNWIHIAREQAMGIMMERSDTRLHIQEATDLIQGGMIIVRA